jgi:hypothetical protein
MRAFLQMPLTHESEQLAAISTEDPMVKIRTALVLALLALSFTAFLGREARAYDDYDPFTWNWNLHSGPAGHYRHRYYRPAHRQTEVHDVRYYRPPDGDRPGAERSDRESTESFHCLDPVRGVGSQWIGTAGALDAARKDWMERVRYDHGEKYLDLTNSRDFTSRCGRVSIGEVIGQVTYRCEMWARPCKAIMKDQPSEDERAVERAHPDGER